MTSPVDILRQDLRLYAASLDCVQDLLGRSAIRKQHVHVIQQPDLVVQHVHLTKHRTIIARLRHGVISTWSTYSSTRNL